MLVNFCSSIGIVWVNKLVYRSGFDFPITLTVIHFFVTYVCMKVARLGGHQQLSWSNVLPISLVFCGFVVFNNLSLAHNSVSTYQLMKVGTTPVIVVLQRQKLPSAQYWALAMICIGVGLATGAGAFEEANWTGALFGLAGVLSTSLYQVWVKSEQVRLRCSSEELLRYQAPLSGAVLLLGVLPFSEEGGEILEGGNFSVTGSTQLILVTVSSLLAASVNLSIFQVISKSSPLAYNVLGHGKLCVILLSGFVLFGEPCSYQCVSRVAIALAGIGWYSVLKSVAAPNALDALNASSSKMCIT